MSTNEKKLQEAKLENIVKNGILLWEKTGLCTKKSTWTPTTEFVTENPKYKIYEWIELDSFTISDEKKIDFKTFSLSNEIDIGFWDKGALYTIFVPGVEVSKQWKVSSETWSDDSEKPSWDK